MQSNDRQGKRSRRVSVLLSMLIAVVMFAGVVSSGAGSNF